MESFAINRDNNTGGLTSAYQLTQLTGAGTAVFVDTAGYVHVGVVNIPTKAIVRPRRVVEIEEELPWDGGQTFDADPAQAAFIGPIGTPRTHEQRAKLLRQNYRAAPDEIYTDIPAEFL